MIPSLVTAYGEARHTARDALEAELAAIEFVRFNRQSSSEGVVDFGDVLTVPSG